MVILRSDILHHHTISLPRITWAGGKAACYCPNTGTPSEAFVDCYGACVSSSSCDRVDQITWNLSLHNGWKYWTQWTNIILKACLSLEEWKGSPGAKNENENYVRKPQESCNHVGAGLPSSMLALQCPELRFQRLPEAGEPNKRLSRSVKVFLSILLPATFR